MAKCVEGVLRARQRHDLEVAALDGRQRDADGERRLAVDVDAHAGRLAAPRPVCSQRAGATSRPNSVLVEPAELHRCAVGHSSTGCDRAGRRGLERPLSCAGGRGLVGDLRLHDLLALR